MQSKLIPAIYKTSDLAESAGNPLIEALPGFKTGREMLAHFGRKPRFDEAERELPAAHRMLCVSRLNAYLELMPAHTSILEQIGLLIHSGYVHRNPVNPEFKKQLVHFYRQSMEGAIRPIETSGPATAPSFSLFGVSGVGKSTVLERALSFYPQALSHEDHGFFQLVWLKVDCPMDGSLKQLLWSIIEKIDRILDTKHAREISRTTTIDKLILDVAKIAARHHLGVLVVDEIQHLLAAAGVGPAKMLNFFVTFANEVKIPFVVLGTPKAQSFLDKLFREARRLSDHGSTFWDRMAFDSEWDFFLSALWEYQWLRTATPLTPELSSAMYHQTQGISALVVRLFQLVQLQAIRGAKSERISVSLIEKVAKEKFTLLRPALEALRSGNQKKIGEFEDLLAEGIIQLEAELHPLQRAQAQKVAEKQINEQRARMTSNLLHAGVDAKDAGMLVERIFSSATADGNGLDQMIDLTKNVRSPSAAKLLTDTLQNAVATKVDPIAALRASGLISDLGSQ
jgi:hypothetical protein